MTGVSSPCRIRVIRMGILAFAMALGAAHGFARTITLTGQDCDQVAFLNEAAPLESFAVQHLNKGVFGINHQVQLLHGMAILIRFPLQVIPKDQRILKAELTLHSQYNVAKARIQVRKVLADWGPGVCHKYRRTVPMKLEWSQPGARGAGTDRANKDSGVFAMAAVGNHTIDLTEDVELWHTGAVANRGWILSPEPNSGGAYLASPFAPNHDSPKQWKLQITFESP